MRTTLTRGTATALLPALAVLVLAGCGNETDSGAVGCRRREVTVDQTAEEQTPAEFVWMLHARCRGASPTEFFPSDGLGVEAAQRVCAGCSVRAECLEYALAHRIEHGVWGGAS